MGKHLPTDPTNAHLCPLQSLHSRDIGSIGSRADGPTQRRLHIRPYDLVSRISALGLRLAEPGDPALGEADADVNLVGLERCDHVACA